MAAVTRLGLYGGTRSLYGSFAGKSPAPASIALSGGPFTEVQIRAGGQGLTLEVSNDTWVASGATFNAQRQNIIDGISAGTSPALGWNAEVRDKEVVTAVVRTSDTVVTITLTAAPLYDIESDETGIEATIPATALVGAVAGSKSLTTRPVKSPPPL